MRIHIFGASGSGVTTLGLALAKQLDHTYLDSDAFYWEPSNTPFTIRRNPEERNTLIKSEIRKSDRWILGGSVVSWGEEWLAAFDLAVFLWIPPSIRINRLKTRELGRYGNIIFEDKDRKIQYEKFIKWASGYDDNSSGGSRTLSTHKQWMQQLTCPLIELRGDYTVEERLGKIITQIT